MKYFLPVVLLVFALTGCGPKKHALYVPTHSTVEIPVFGDDKINEFMVMYAKHHDDTLIVYDLMIQGDSGAAQKKMKDSYDESLANSLFERMKETAMALKDNPSDLARYQEYGRNIGKETQQRLDAFEKKYPGVMAQGQALLDAEMAKQDTAATP